MSDENLNLDPTQPVDPTIPPLPEYGQTTPAQPYAQPYVQPGMPAAGMPAYPGMVPGMPGVVPVPWTARAYGALIDWIPIFVAGFIVGLVGNQALYYIVMLLAGAYGIYNIGYLGGTTGVTFGRKMAGTKLVSEQTLLPIGAGPGIARYFVHFLDFLICGIGFLFPLFMEKRQTIADMIMKTIVIKDDSAGSMR
ncbi:MAG: RDD family protein [Propionibacteriaceae bacterium]|nr:RDD family protein [Propionibacteriaceae bacterium]